MFPLSQYDLPTHTDEILSFPKPATAKSLQPGPTQDRSASRNVLNHHPAVLSQAAATPKSTVTTATQSALTEEQLRRNPEVDYTK